MSGSVLTALGRAIRYPDDVPSGAFSFSFLVDGGAVEATVERNRLILRRDLAAAEEVDLALFAGYAAGRVLREEAVLAYDPETDRVLLWQDIPAEAEASLLCRFFEVFAASCDWWLARVKGGETASAVPEMMIRP